MQFVYNRKSEMSPLKIDSFNTDIEKGNYAFKLAFIETILSDNNIISSLDENGLKELIKETDKNNKILSLIIICHI